MINRIKILANISIQQPLNFLPAYSYIVDPEKYLIY